MFVSLVLNGTFLVIEAVAGFLTGSLALISDATHMLSDVAALSLALLASRLALRPATHSTTFGLRRAEVLGAFVNAVGLLVACMFIFNEAVARLTAGTPPLAGGAMIAVAFAGLIVNLGSAWLLHRSDEGDNLNVRGALIHMLADALGSVGALIAGVLIMVYGWTAADAIASFVIGLLVLWGAWLLLRDSARVLLEFAPKGLERNVIEHALLEVDGVDRVHDLHVWMLGGGEALVAVHLVPSMDAAPFEVLQSAQSMLRSKLGVAHTTVQIEPADGPPCHQECCPVLTTGSES